MTWVDYEPGLADEIAARLDLRRPNALALHKVIQAIGEGDGTEAIADLATGVGKTYLAVGLIEYLASQGQRDFLIVVPGDTIHEKTIANFTPGSLKFVPGSDFSPVIITADNYRDASIGAALSDPAVVKVFIFKVQTLIRPSDKVSRRVREANEWIEGPLYDYLQTADDLTVIADEHHVYHEKAKAFSDAIRSLAPRALIGLTATPSSSDVDKIVFSYSLAEAIADELVKIPVIVFRPDGIKSVDVQLADACHLRAIKDVAWTAWAETNGRVPVKPVLFVVCQTIEEAEVVAEHLTASSLLPAEGQILLITGQSSDVALAQLAAVESPESPVRAVVSVDKLKEGWDVKNIGVIVALRVLASEALTEQILGRGLRLPYGFRVGSDPVDTVDIVAHDSYKTLLEKKDVLLRQVVGERQEAATQAGTEKSAAPRTGRIIVPSDPENHQINFEYGSLEGDGEDTGTDPGILMKAQEFEEVEQQTKEATANFGKLLTKVESAPDIVFPRLEREMIPQRFSLKLIRESDARALGARSLEDQAIYMRRTALTAERGLNDELIVSTKSLEEAKAYVETTTVDKVRRDLNVRVFNLSIVEQDLDEIGAAESVIEWFLEGAGVTGDDDEHAEWSVKRGALAAKALEALIIRAYEDRVSQPDYHFRAISIPRVPPTRQLPYPLLSRWQEQFVKGGWYSPWEKSVEVAASFDAKSTEFRLADAFDSSAQVDWWLRTYANTESWIECSSRKYFVDFIVIEKDGMQWIVEGKADDHANDADVLAKKDAALEWVRQVNESGSFGKWRYMFATESALRDSKGRWADLKKSAGL